MSIIKQAKILIKNDKKTEAGNLLIEYLKSSREDEKAWLLLAECVDLRRRKIISLKQAYALNPKNRKTKKYLSLFAKGKDPEIKQNIISTKMIGVIVFGLLLPLATVAGFSSLIKNSIPDYLPPTLPSPLNEQPLPAEFSFLPTVEPAEAVKGQVENQILKGEEEVEEIILAIPDIPSSYCVPTDTTRRQGKVLAVLDANSLQVDMGDEIVAVHYLGIESPGIEDFGGANALEANMSLEGQDVLFVSDGPEKNENGEYLAYVFAGDYFINYQMAEWGLANISADVAKLTCAGFLMAAENNAKENELGLWQYIDVRMDPYEWKTWPVVPLFSKNAIDIYKAGLAEGYDSTHFSIMGDCQAPEWRMFGPFVYQSFIMPEIYEYLQPTLDNYAGQWARNSVTVKSGNTVASLFSVAWSDPARCGSTETPIDCELRVNNPAVSLIMLGTNWPQGQNEDFESRLREVIRYLIARNVLPIIVTKGDATEDSYPLNHIMAQVAYDYDIPLWNFWAGIQELENHGMDATDVRNMHISSIAFPVKRWTGLQTLHALREAAFGD